MIRSDMRGKQMKCPLCGEVFSIKDDDESSSDGANDLPENVTK
jgi:hypothetical protein